MTDTDNENPIIKDRITLLYEAMRNEQATITNIDWKARTLLTVNSITVPVVLGIISFTSVKKDLFSDLTLQHPIVLMLLAVFLLLLCALSCVFYFTLRVIDPRVQIAENINYPADATRIRDLDVHFPVHKGGKVDFDEYRSKLETIQDRETIELVLLKGVLSLSLIRDDKIRTLNKALVALGVDAVLVLLGVLLFLFLML